jgi:hypothetical protein
MRITAVIRLMLLSFFMLAIPATAFAQVAVSITIAPPELPVYEQPLCPGDGYIWTPGYWAYDYDIGDYYWVPGTWVEAPEVGFFWTPAYWGWGGGAFVFNEGYWGPTIGLYGGIDYGFGYVGHGYEGGRWDNGHFFYNTTANNVNVTVIHNVYNTKVVEKRAGATIRLRTRRKTPLILPPPPLSTLAPFRLPRGPLPRTPGPEAGQKIPAATGQAECAAGEGTAATPGKTGQGTPTTGETEG